MKKLIKVRTGTYFKKIEKNQVLSGINDDMAILKDMKVFSLPCRKKFRKHLIYKSKTTYKDLMSSGIDISHKDIKRLENPSKGIIPLTTFDILKALLMEMQTLESVDGNYRQLSECLVMSSIWMVRTLIVTQKKELIDLENKILNTDGLLHQALINTEIQVVLGDVHMCQQFLEYMENFDSQNRVNDNKYLLEELQKFDAPLNP